MAEKTRVIERHVVYSGLFNYRELFRLIDFWYRDKFYDKKEKLTAKMEHPDGNHFSFHFEPWKKVTDYYKIQTYIDLVGTGIKEVEVEIDGKKVRLNHGKIEVMIVGNLISDYEGKLMSRGIYQLMHTLFDRYVYRHMTKKNWELSIDVATVL